MTVDIEGALRETLSDRAEQIEASGDPWPRFAELDRRHRRRRQVRTAAIAVASVTAVGLVGSGIVPLPSWVPAITVEGASSPLLDGPPAGSLAENEEWLMAFGLTF